MDRKPLLDTVAVLLSSDGCCARLGCADRGGHWCPNFFVLRKDLVRKGGRRDGKIQLAAGCGTVPAVGKMFWKQGFAGCHPAAVVTGLVAGHV